MTNEAKRKVVETTRTLMQTQGYNATGLNQIIKVSGTPKGSLYHYFPGGKVRLDAFEEAGLKRPDGSPFSFGDTEITYVWAADYVGATTQALDEEGRAEASRKGWEIVELQEDLSKGVPASLIELLGGLA